MVPNCSPRWQCGELSLVNGIKTTSMRYVSATCTRICDSWDTPCMMLKAMRDFFNLGKKAGTAAVPADLGGTP
jgi:hypothetical protein